MESDFGMDFILLNQESSCASVSGSSCPEGVGRVFVRSRDDERQFTLCTGFLMSEDRMMTNGHCLSRSEDCPRTFVSFSSAGKSYSAQCSKLVKSYYNEENPAEGKDLTIFTLTEKIPVEPFRVSIKPAQKGECYSVWVMDHFNMLQARITELECLYEGQGLGEEYSGCPAIQGNSGSPIINDSGEVVSILWGSSLDRSVDANINLLERRSLSAFSYAYGLQFLRGTSLER